MCLLKLFLKYKYSSGPKLSKATQRVIDTLKIQEGTFGLWITFAPLSVDFLKAKTPKPLKPSIYMEFEKQSG